MMSTNEERVIELAFGDVRSKRIETSNDFVSHMIAHIARRLGCCIDLERPGQDWVPLGRALGGRTVMNGLLPENLDDFPDGLSRGLGCDIAIHVKDLPPADAAWPLIFENLGIAPEEAFEKKPYRKGVTPGVKANLS